MLIILQKVVFNTKLSQTIFKQRVLFFKQISWKTHFIPRHAYNFAKRSFQQKMKSNTIFQQRVVFFKQISCKTNFIGHAYNFAKGSL